MVVLVLIGIMTALMIPEMRGTFESAVLRAAARKVVNACNLAHSRAVTRNEVHRVHIDRVRSRYAIEAMAAGKFTPLQDVAGGEGELDRRVTLEMRQVDDGSEDEQQESKPQEQNKNAIAFYPDGTADAAEIALRDRHGFQLNLRVNPITGRVEVFESESTATFP
jgi:Tfp pilus assembly protein FimT